MDVETYNLSRTYLFRYHTLRTLKDILKSSGCGVPASMCTPQWFLENYLLHSAYPSYCRWQRINSLDDMDSSGEGTCIASEHTSAAPPSSDAQTHRPRHLRTVHKNEVWSIFASHSRWILSCIHKGLKGKVDISSWRIFLSQTPQLRQKAMLDQDTCGRWGLIDEQGGNKIPPSLSMPKIVICPTATPRIQKQNKQCISTKVCCF
jgi:hypothetical protein